MPYTRTTWQDFPNTTTPITAARLNNSEAFLASISTIADAWTSYTPTLTNCTSPITVAKYSQVGKTVQFYVVLTLTGAQVSGLIGVSLPVACSVAMSGGFEALIYRPSALAIYPAIAYTGTTSRLDLYAQNAAGTYVVHTATSSTVPITFASADIIYVAGQYESV